jgi:DNA (cytosine-5)-methyltransferase 3A
MKLLIGGSPCTHWSIAQTKNRETEASGIGWELFLNYRIARDKYQPDYFLYENNKSMSPAIRAQITAELGVEPVLINSALVSAQNRQRLYWAGKRNPDGTYRQVPVELPEDRGILLRDILETGFPLREKGYALQTGHGTTAEDAIARRQRNAVAEPVAIKPLTEKEMEYMVRETKDGRNHFGFDYFHDATKDKSACVTANTHKGVPYNVLAEPVRIGTIENDARNQDHDSQQYRVYSPDGKSVTLCGNGGGLGAKTGLYAVPISAENNKVILKAIDSLVDRKGYVPEMFNPYNRAEVAGKAPTLSTGSMVTSSCAVLIFETADGKQIPAYQVRDGRITIKGKEYPVKLRDGLYIIRKLTVTECKRLQTVPDTYAFPVSDTQAYKMLGNGWTVDVIAHIMGHFEGLTAEPVEVLSMYDGMSCGHIALGKLGAEIASYHATEIDKFAIQTTQANFPDVVQLGDAFQVREDGWTHAGLTGGASEAAE